MLRIAIQGYLPDRDGEFGGHELAVVRITIDGVYHGVFIKPRQQIENIDGNVQIVHSFSDRPFAEPQAPLLT